MIPSHVRESIGYMIDDCAQTDYEDFQQIDLGCVEQWLKADNEPITQEALKAAGWEYMQWNGVVDEWYRQFAPSKYYYLHSNCVGVRFNEYKSDPGARVYIIMPSTRIHVPGCITMAQIRELVEMLRREAPHAR